jgi:hypothetical protein
VAEAIDRYQETLRALVQQQLAQVAADQLPAATSAATAIALRSVPVLLEEVRGLATAEQRAVIDTLAEAADVVQVLAEPRQVKLLASLPATGDLVPRAIEGAVEREHSVLKGAIEGALADVGYEVVTLPPAGRKQPLQVRGRHADGTVMSFEADARCGRLSLDLEGFSNGACVQARGALLRALKARGVETDLVAEAAHCELGGPLTRRIDAVIDRKTKAKPKKAAAASAAQPTPRRLRGQS